jgi:hypothetical protein
LLVAQVFSFNALEQVGSRGWTLSGVSKIYTNFSA